MALLKQYSKDPSFKQSYVELESDILGQRKHTLWFSRLTSKGIGLVGNHSTNYGSIYEGLSCSSFICSCKHRGETSCVLAVRPDLVNMAKAVNEKDYKMFFEYRMDQYTKSGIVGRDTTKSTAEFGEQIFSMVVDALVPMIKDALNEKTPRNQHNNNYNYNKQKKKKH